MGHYSTHPTFIVTVRDAQDNLIGRGGDAVTIDIVGQGTLHVTDNGDGTYSATFSGVLGSFDVTITLNGTPIGGARTTLP